jgi:hypothetical protein
VGMNFIDELAPASPDKVNLYAPYFIRAATKRTLLPKAITLYYKGGLNGTRFVEGGEKIPFTMTWAIRDLPGDTTRCRVIFDENVDYTYEVSLVNSEFVSFLIDWLTNFRDSHQQDFPPLFYRKLFRVED